MYAATDVRLGMGWNDETSCGCWEKAVAKDVKSSLHAIVAVPVADVAVSIIGVGVVVNVGVLLALRASISS